MVSCYQSFPADVISVGLVFSVQVLITRFIGARCHGGHPEVIGIGSEGIEGLLEGYDGLLEK